MYIYIYYTFLETLFRNPSVFLEVRQRWIRKSEEQTGEADEHPCVYMDYHGCVSSQGNIPESNPANLPDMQ